MNQVPGARWVRVALCGAALLALACGSPGARDADAGQEPASDAGPRFEFDIVVVGAGTGGIAAAIQAARMGARVALLEETDWIGGQATSAGVSTMDEWSPSERDYGLYGELVARVQAHYGALGKSVQTCYWGGDRMCMEPSVARAQLQAMIDDTPGIELFLRRRAVSAETDGNAVTAVATEGGETFAARVIIDATERGDVIPLAGAAYRIGNTTGDAPDPAACIQDITYTAIIRKYDRVPPAFALSGPPDGYAEEAPYFALLFSPDVTKFFDFTYPASWESHSAYRGTPDSARPGSYTAAGTAEAALITRTGVNWANDYPRRALYIPLPDQPTLSIDYLENPELRRQIDCAAKLRTVQFIYDIQTRMGQPLWSVADDEGYDGDYNRTENDCPEIPEALAELERNMPVRPYVRESRRIIGLHTLSGPEVFRTGSPLIAAVAFPTSLGIGGYGTDLHNCDSDEQLELEFESSAHIQGGGGPFQIPFESFIPIAVDGLVAAEKNLSMTRLVSGATRLQPVTMGTGQAAGAIAALAALGGIAPREVRPIDVQEALVGANVRLSLHAFSDVPPGDARWADVEISTTHEIVTGAGASVFSPDAAMTRADVAGPLARLFNLDVSSPPTTASFDDVPVAHPSFAAIEALRAAGYTAGCSAAPALYCPNAPATRAQIAVFLVRGLGLDTAQAPAAPLFSDVPASHALFAFIQLAGQTGLMQGCTATDFCPDDAEQRARLAFAVRRVLRR